MPGRLRPGVASAQHQRGVPVRANGRTVSGGPLGGVLPVELREGPVQCVFIRAYF